MSDAISLEEIRRYGGSHVSLVDGRIVSASKNPAEAYCEAKRKYPDRNIILTYVPTEDTLIL